MYVWGDDREFRGKGVSGLNFLYPATLSHLSSLTTPSFLLVPTICQIRGSSMPTSTTSPAALVIPASCLSLPCSRRGVLAVLAFFLSIRSFFRHGHPRLLTSWRLSTDAGSGPLPALCCVLGLPDTEPGSTWVGQAEWVACLDELTHLRTDTSVETGCQCLCPQCSVPGHIPISAYRGYLWGARLVAQDKGCI